MRPMPPSDRFADLPDERRYQTTASYLHDSIYQCCSTRRTSSACLCVFLTAFRSFGVNSDFFLLSLLLCLCLPMMLPLIKGHCCGYFTMRSVHAPYAARIVASINIGNAYECLLEGDVRLEGEWRGRCEDGRKEASVKDTMR
jgi:hypothetical protein